MRNAEPLADLRDHLGFGAAFGAERMIDGRRFDLAGPRLGGEEQQGEAVGTARNRDADARVGLDERVEVAPERSIGRVGALLASPCARAKRAIQLATAG